MYIYVYIHSVVRQEKKKLTVCSRAKMPYAALDALSRGCEWEYVDAIFHEWN